MTALPTNKPTIVVHCRKEKSLPEGYTEYVYVGRPSKWGNPFILGLDGTREEVIAKYLKWIQHNPLLQDILELKGKVLGCWCKPLPCHGDVLAHLANAASLSPEGKVQLTLPTSTSEWRGWYGTSE